MSTKIKPVDIGQIGAMCRLLTRAAVSIVGVLELEEVLRRLVVEARHATGARYGALGVVGRDAKLEQFVHDGMRPETVRAIGRLPEGRGVLGTLTRDPRPMRLDRVSEHPDHVGFPRHHPVLHNFLGVPVRSGDDIYGNLYLAEAPDGFTELDEMVASSLAAIAGAAIEAARLHNGVEVLAVAADRSRIGRELHDTIVQQMFAIGVEIQATAGLGDPRVASRLRSTVAKIDAVIDDLRHVVADYNPVGPEMEPPLLALQDAVNDLSDSYDFPVGLSVKPVNLRLGQTVADSVRSFVLEAVSNALRHSEGQAIDVEVELDGDHLTVSIADDGDGFDPDIVSVGQGLFDLRERAHALGGEFVLSTQPGSGTKVGLSVDLSSDPL